MTEQLVKSFVDKIIANFIKQQFFALLQNAIYCVLECTILRIILLNEIPFPNRGCADEVTGTFSHNCDQLT